MKLIKGLIYSVVTVVAINAVANDQLIVKFKSKDTAMMMMNHLQGPGMPEIKEIAADFNLFTIKKGVGIHVMSTASIKNYLEQVPEVEYVQYDHPITPREASPPFIEKVLEMPKVEESVEDPVVVSAEELVEEPVVVSAEEPVVDSVEESVVGSAEEPVVGSVEESVEEPVVGSVEEPVVDSAEESVEEPVVGSVEESAEEPVVDSVEESVVGSAEEPVVGSVEESVVVSAEEPVVVSAEEPVVGSVEESVVDSAEEPVVVSAEEPVVGSVEESVVGSAEESVVGSAEEPVVDSVEEPVVGSAEEPVVDSVEEPIVDSVEESPPIQLSFFQIPKDTNFNKQWALQKSMGEGVIGAPEAWNITKGGKDANGHEIVVAVIDTGILTEHEDLKDNIWVNKNEIAGNGIDDDNNGFVDDINGWDFTDGDGQLKVNRHGTHVSGIIGARGDNNIGISGVNWDVKVMGITARLSSTSNIIKAYAYVLKSKELWVKSKGKEGANIVATNSSFGHDRADCNSGEYPVWNDIYEQMGKLGILSAAAGPNSNWDVDEVGDVPTGCNSDYLVTVTSTDQRDKKVVHACYGQTTIDISAPGESIYSTISANEYDEMSGTSMATPHISGAIALMHAAASKKFADAYFADPAQASLELKDMLLNAVKKTTDLEQKLVSGGRLDIFKAVTDISKYK